MSLKPPCSLQIKKIVRKNSEETAWNPNCEAVVRNGIDMFMIRKARLSLIRLFGSYETDKIKLFFTLPAIHSCFGTYYSIFEYLK